MGIIEESKQFRRSGLLGLFRQKKFYIIIFLIVAGGASAYYFSSDKNSKQAVVAPREWTVKKGDIKIAIEADGKVVAEDGVELSFPVSGDNLEVKDVFVKQGDTVKKGDKIATVKTETLEFNLRSAYSSYQSALADYKEALNGPTNEEIKKSQSAIEQAKLSLDQAKISLEKIKTAAKEKIAVAEDAVETAKENLDKNRNEEDSEDVNEAYEDLINTIKSVSITLEDMLPDSDKILGIDNVSINDDFQYNLGAKDAMTLTNAKNSYRKAQEAEAALEQYAISISKNSSHSDVDKAAEQAEAALDAFEKHLYYMQAMLEATVTSVDLSQTALDSFKSTINSNRSSVNTKISALDTAIHAVLDAKEGLDDYVKDYEEALRDLEIAKEEAEQDIANAEKNITAKELSLEQAKINYNELMAPLTAAELASAKSKLNSALINYEKARLELEKATIVSPIDGEVAMLNYKPGDIIIDNSTSDPVAIIINNDTLFIEVNIEEDDINKIKVGQKVKAEFDALDGLTLDGEVSFISLTSKTNNSGIVTYLVRVLIDNSGEHQIREGMTAFVDFIIAGVNDVLIAPVNAVRNIDGKPSVQLASGEWKPVTTGFTDGEQVEIISGLDEGNKIIY